MILVRDEAESPFDFRRAAPLGSPPVQGTGTTTIAVVPARYASQRFPGKPLADIRGTPMIVRVAQQAAKAAEIARVIVATDDPRIFDVVEGAGFEARMTSEACQSGSDRVAEVARTVDADLVVNVQGDEPLLDPRDLDALVAAAHANPDGITTLGRRLAGPAELEDPNVVKAVVAPNGRALYFSRAPIPHGARVEDAVAHVGLYAYPPAVLTRFTQLAPSPLEQRERLEQLRALENGIPIQLQMCVSVRPSIGVDVPEDLDAVLRVLDLEQREQSHEQP